MRTTSKRHNVILTAGLTVGISTVILTFIVMLSGWYKHPSLFNGFFGMFLFEVGGLFWGLQKLSKEKTNFLELALSGTLISVVAAALGFIFSYLFTAFVFPGYFADVVQVQKQVLLDQGVSPDKVNAAAKIALQYSTPFKQAVSGFIGTVMSGVLLSTIIAMFLKPSHTK